MDGGDGEDGLQDYAWASHPNKGILSVLLTFWSFTQKMFIGQRFKDLI